MIKRRSRSLMLRLRSRLITEHPVVVRLKKMSGHPRKRKDRPPDKRTPEMSFGQKMKFKSKPRRCQMTDHSPTMKLFLSSM